MIDPCAKCEEVLQPYLDRELTDAERAEAEQMPPERKAKLAALRTPLV